MTGDLGKLLKHAPAQGVAVRVLSRAEGKPAWRDARLVGVATLGISIASNDAVDCLPWGSVAAVRVPIPPAEDG